MERDTRIERASSAWKAEAQPLYQSRVKPSHRDNTPAFRYRAVYLALRGKAASVARRDRRLGEKSDICPTIRLVGIVRILRRKSSSKRNVAPNCNTGILQDRRRTTAPKPSTGSGEVLLWLQVVGCDTTRPLTPITLSVSMTRPPVRQRGTGVITRLLAGRLKSEDATPQMITPVSVDGVTCMMIGHSDENASIYPPFEARWLHPA